MSISELQPLKSSGTEPAPSGGDSGDLVGGDKPLLLSPDSVPEFVLEEDGAVPSWSRATFRFQQRLSAGSEHVARFTTPWARKTRGKLLSADSEARDWAQTTALLTFTGSPFLGDSREPMPPVSFLDAIRQPARARRRRLRRMLDETAGRWLTIRVIGATESTGYPHSHVAVYADTRLSESDFEPVVQAHLDGCPVAQQSAHGHGTVVVEHEPRESKPTGVVNYLNQNVPGVKSLYDDGDARSSGQNPKGVVDESTARQRTATVLEATRTDAYSIQTSDGVEWDT